MRRRLLILTTVLFLIAGAAYLYVASGRLHQRVRLALEAAAGRHFHRQVRIAALRGDPLQGLVLEGVAVARGERLAEGTIVTADQIAVRFRPPPPPRRPPRAPAPPPRPPRRVHAGGDAGGWARDRYRFLRAAPSLSRALGRSERTGGPPPASRGAAGVRPGQRARRPAHTHHRPWEVPPGPSNARRRPGRPP